MISQLFNHWGLPQNIKVDNGSPFGCPTRDHIPPFALWLIGLAINIIWNRPRQPRDNAKVERMQGTTKRWVDIDQCTSIEQLQQRLDQAGVIQREKYKVTRLNHMTRAQVFPQLYQKLRSYAGCMFDPWLVYAQLAKTRMVRKVSSHGTCVNYLQRYQIGQAFKGQLVCFQWDLDTSSWKVFDRNGQLLKQLPAKNLSPWHIIHLAVCQTTNFNYHNLMSHQFIKT